jgi:arylsulfatase A-like enzyme
MPRRSSSARTAALLGGLLLALGIAALFRYGEDLRPSWTRSRPSHIVLVTFDTLRPDLTGPYNPDIDFTPNLEAFAAEGVVYRRAYTTVPITLPSHASLLSGRAAAELAVMLNGDVVGDDVETLPEILGRHGYRTAAFVSLGVLRARFNLDQGFELYDDTYFRKHRRWYRTADEVLEAARGWIEAQAEEPFFVWLHLSDPHEPYVVKGAPPDVELLLDGNPVAARNLTSKERHAVPLELEPGLHQLTWRSLRKPPPDEREETLLWLEVRGVDKLRPWLADPETDLATPRDLSQPFTLAVSNSTGEKARIRVRFEGGLDNPPVSEVHEQYVREVEYADRYLGELRELFRSLGIDDDTLWILASDHGEGLYRQAGVLGHTDYTYEDQLRILWMMRGPGVDRDRVVEDSPVMIQDILPTVLDLLRLEPGPAVTGLSQADCWRGGGCSRRDEWWAFGASDYDAQVTSVAGYRPPYKLLWHRERSGCYNLEADPWEEVNLAKTMEPDPSSWPPEVARLSARIDEQREYFQERLEARATPDLEPEEVEMLRSLGYLDG